MLATSKPDIPTIEQFLEWNWERLLQEARERRALAEACSEALFAVLKARGVLANQTDWMITSWEYSDTLQQIKKEANRYLPPDELKRQSDAGDPAAQYHQAKELQSVSFDEGVALMTASAMAGYPQAQFEMATSYRHRKRTEQEEQQAIEQWYTQERETLQSQTPAPEGEALALQKKQLEQIEQQRAMLLNDL